MKLATVLSLAFLGAVTVGAWRPASAAEGITKDALEAIAKEVEASAANGIPDNPDGALENKLKAITYDEKSIPALASVLGENRKPPVDTYVATKLLGPLTMATPEVTKKAVPQVGAIASRCVRYLDFPKLSQSELNALKSPDPSSVSVERLLQLKAEAQKRQEAKIARERAVAEQNRQSYKLEMLLYKLQILAGKDQEVVSAIAAAEQKGHKTFSDILDLVREQVGRLGEPRAKVYYEGLKSLAGRVWLKKANYVDFGDVKLSSMDNSGYGNPELCAGQVIVTTLNQVSTAAKMPALKPPTKDQIDKANDKGKKK